MLCFVFLQDLVIIPVQYLVSSLYIRHVRNKEWDILDIVYSITDSYTYKSHQIDRWDADFELDVIKLRPPIGKKGNV